LTPIFDKELETAVKSFQQLHGLKVDGVLSGKTKFEMSINPSERIEQILINMERCKWVPVQLTGDYLVVNIPDFKLFVYHNDSVSWSCNVIVGKSKLQNNTVIFNDSIEDIVLSPYWNVPKSILIKETLPEIRKDINYLNNNNLEIVTNAGVIVDPSSIEWKKYLTSFPYIIRQRPGKNNALGYVKFLFPNPYDIYLHDTPQKSLFEKSQRAFSHGCIRLEKPYQLARYLLKDNSEWPSEKLDSVMFSGIQTYIKLKTKVPIFIAYFTSWVDRNGKLNFRDDIYHHDAKMKEILMETN
jgi:murein L,D-transpeptidase YcbB/YkuD